MGTTDLSVNPSFVGGGVDFSAEDTRRTITDMWAAEGVIGSCDFDVTQRSAGANMSVDVAAGSAIVQGDSDPDQGKYYVRSPLAVNVTVTAADASLPRIDRVVLEVKDTEYDAGGLRVARVRTIDGTPTSGADAALNTNGIAALPITCIELARITVPAADTTIADSQIVDQRAIATLRIGDGGVDEANLSGLTLVTIPHTWAFTGTATTSDTLPDIFIPVPAGRTAKIVAVRHRCTSSSGTFKLQKNGSDVTGFTGIALSTTTTTTDPTDVSISNGDRINPVLTAGTPVNMSISVYVEYGVA